MTERGYALRNGDWRGRIEALCTVGLTASALVQKRSVLLPMVACGSVFGGRCSRDCPSDAPCQYVSRLIDIGRAPKRRLCAHPRGQQPERIRPAPPLSRLIVGSVPDGMAEAPSTEGDRRLVLPFALEVAAA